MSKPKPSTISRDPYVDDPYAFIGTTAKASTPRPPEKAKKVENAKITVVFPAELIEQARDAAYHDRDTLAGIIVQALADSLERKVAERGAPYPPRAKELKRGRRVGS